MSSSTLVTSSTLYFSWSVFPYLQSRHISRLIKVMKLARDTWFQHTCYHRSKRKLSSFLSHQITFFSSSHPFLSFPILSSRITHRNLKLHKTAARYVISINIISHIRRKSPAFHFTSHQIHPITVFFPSFPKFLSFSPNPETPV